MRFPCCGGAPGDMQQGAGSGGRKIMKKVFLAGYYGMQNSGDDALLAAAAWGVRNFLAPERILVNVATLPAIPAAEMSPVFRPDERFALENRLRGYAACLRSQSVVYGGGSLFHSSAGIRSNVNQLRLAGRGPHYAVGVGLGPFKSLADERACAELLRRLEFVGVRDRESLEIARALAPALRSEKTFDLAPLILRASPGGSATAPAGRRGIGISLCDYERFSGGDRVREEQRRLKVIAALKRLDPEEAGELVFIDFNGHPEYGDHALHREIMAALAGRFRVRQLPYSPDPWEVLREIGSLRAVVAMRLHAAVFGFLSGTPTVILSYHPKCRGWADDIGLPGRFVLDSAAFEPEELAARIGEASGQPGQGARLAVSEAEALALRNFEILRG